MHSRVRHMRMHLAHNLVPCRKQVKRLRAELKDQGGKLQAAQAARDEAQAAVRVVSDERQQMKTEWTEMFSAHDGLKSKISELTNRLWAAEAKLKVRRSAAASDHDAFCTIHRFVHKCQTMESSRSAS
jgi:chromosome segregation ATPase